MENKTRIEVTINNEQALNNDIRFLLSRLDEIQNIIGATYQVNIFTSFDFPEYDPIQESLESYEMKKDDNIKILCNKYSYIGQDKIQCSICMLDFEEKDTIGELDCNHSFHFRCIKEWGKYKQECPLCRQEIAIEKNEIF